MVHELSARYATFRRDYVARSRSWLDRLASEGRQALLSVPGDVYLMLDGQRTLVRQTP